MGPPARTTCGTATQGETFMSRNIRAAFVVVAGLGLAPPAGQQPAESVEGYLAAAKEAAGFDFSGTLVRLCVAPQTAPGRDVAPPPPPARGIWYTEPGKVFDNLYFVGSRIQSAWALTSSAGIILLDTLYD